MNSKLIKTIVVHVLVLVGGACISLYAVNRYGVSWSSSNFMLLWKLFWGVFSYGALALGMTGILGPSVLVGRCLLRNSDLNDQLIREEIGLLIFSTAEICFALVGLYFSGSVTFKFSH